MQDMGMKAPSREGVEGAEQGEVLGFRAYRV